MNVEISLSELKKYLNENIDFEELVEVLFQLKLEIEEKEETGEKEEGDAEQEEDDGIKDKVVIELSPDRPDLLSIIGIANLINNFKWNKKPKVDFPLNKDDVEYCIKVNPNIKKIRPYIVGAIVKDVIISDQKLKEIMNFQERLHTTFARNRAKASIGLYQFELLKFPLHYAGKDPNDISFEPLGCNRVMTANMILEDHPTGIKYGHLLDKFDIYPLFFDNSKQVLSLPPIINSNFLGKLESDDKIPQNVFIEVTGTEPYIVQKCLSIVIVDLMLHGGKAYEVISEYPDGSRVKSPDLSPVEWTVSLELLFSYFGEKLSLQEIESLLNKIGYLLESSNNKEIKVKTLPNRYDIMHEVDVIEDIIMAYGMQNIKYKVPELVTTAKEKPIVPFKNIFRRFFANLGYIEVVNYILTDSEILTKKMRRNTLDYISLTNAKLEQFSAIRPDLTAVLLNYLSFNLNNPFPQSIFEVGNVIEPNDNSYNRCIESLHVAGAVSGSKININNLKSELDLLFRLLQQKVEYKAIKNEFCFDGRTYSVIVNGKNLGFFGEIHPEVLNNFNLKMPTMVFELKAAQIFPIFKNYI